jgi:mRNA degradation ribonuclease J1/J2
MSVIKDLTVEEIQELKDLSSNYNRLCMAIGHSWIQISYLEQTLKELNGDKEGFLKDYKVITEKQDVLQKILLEKYGEGAIDIESGKIEVF